MGWAKYFEEFGYNVELLGQVTADFVEVRNAGRMTPDLAQFYSDFLESVNRMGQVLYVLVETEPAFAAELSKRSGKSRDQILQALKGYHAEISAKIENRGLAEPVTVVAIVVGIAVVAIAAAVAVVAAYNASVRDSEIEWARETYGKYYDARRAGVDVDPPQLPDRKDDDGWFDKVTNAIGTAGVVLVVAGTGLLLWKIVPAFFAKPDDEATPKEQKQEAA
jgi:hypothetical protein